MKLSQVPCGNKSTKLLLNLEKYCKKKRPSNEGEIVVAFYLG